MNKTALQEITGILCRLNPKQIIILLTVFFLIYSALGSAPGNMSGTEESADLLNESLLSQNETFSFGSLDIFDGNNNPLFCMVTLYDDEGILKVSDFTDCMFPRQFGEMGRFSSFARAL